MEVKGKGKTIKLSELKPNKSNPRVIAPEKIDKLKKSITDFEEMMYANRIVVDENNVILGGNMRYKALELLGYKNIPEAWVYKALDWTEEQKSQFIIKDNVGFGDWDWEILKNEWHDLPLEDWGLDIPDWGLEEVGESEQNYQEPENLKVDVAEGDLIEFFCQDGRVHRLICGSSLEADSWEKLTVGKEIDLVVTDPPYNINYFGKTKDALTIRNDSLSDDDFYHFLYDFYTTTNLFVKKGGVWYVWHANTEASQFISAMKDAGILLKQCLIWVKNSMVLGRQDYQWMHEPCLYGWKEGAAHNWYSDRKQTTVLEFDRPSVNSEHPTMKPIPLIAYQIGNSSKRGDIVADGFLGSGTTMIAAHETNRIAVGCEIDPKYCQVIIDRMKKLDPTIKIKINGKYYSQEVVF